MPTIGPIAHRTGDRVPEREVAVEKLRKPLSIAFGLMAVAVLLHFVLSSFYEDSVNVDSMWYVFNWIMAVGIVLALADIYIEKRALSEAEMASQVWVNVALYAAVVLAILFAWNWFDDLTAGEDGQSQVRLAYWAVIDVWFIVLIGTRSICLWKS